MLQANHPTTARRGSTSLKAFDYNPETVMIRLMRENPKGPRTREDVYRRRIRDLAYKTIFEDERYREALNEYCFKNMYNNAQKHVTPAAEPPALPAKPAIQIQKEREQLQADIRGKIDAAINLRALKVLDIVMPNGKRVFDNSGTYIRLHADTVASGLGTVVGKALRALGDGLGARSPREAGLTEESAQELARAACG